ncbi:MAG: thiamine-monophosphate kinase [Phycisphaerae bacterium]
MTKGEDNLVAWMAGRLRDRDQRSESDGVTLDIGDDMALLAPGGGAIAVTSDMLMDGVHFDTQVHDPRAIGRKALAASLSDCAAMAVRPRWVLVSLALPDAWSMEQAQTLFLGIEDLAKAFDCTIIGGDTNSWTRPLVVDVTVLAEPYPDVTPVRRDGVVAGDELFVTGRLGGSLLEHHLAFTPRVAEAYALARRLGSDLHAMMDLSDGLSTDAARMARSSGCGLVFDTDAIERVVSDTAREMSREDGRSPLDHALNDGEDFELLFASAAGALEQPETTRVGIAIDEPGVWLRTANGIRTPLEPVGWRHFQ